MFLGYPKKRVVSCRVDSFKNKFYFVHYSLPPNILLTRKYSSYSSLDNLFLDIFMFFCLLSVAGSSSFLHVCMLRIFIPTQSPISFFYTFLVLLSLKKSCILWTWTMFLMHGSNFSWRHVGRIGCITIIIVL